MFQPSSLIIRPEHPNDANATRQILIDAFANHRYSDQTEHLIVDKLRAENAITLGLVAELNNVIVGYIVFSAVKINGEDLNWYGLGPIAVKPDQQKKGIGKALMAEG